MTNRLNYYWRLAATGGCFTAFGLGGLLLSIVVFPALFLLPVASRSRHARWVIHKAFGGFIGLMKAVGVMQLEVVGGERLKHCRNMLVLANHPTLIDVVALISLMPNVSCVVKQAVWNNPFMRGAVRSANYISNGEPDHLLQACADDLAVGNPLLIFPEGTRSQPGQPLRFLRGASYLVLKSGLPVLPVLIDCQPSTLTKSEKWYHIPSRRFHLRVRVLDPLNIQNRLLDDESSNIAARRLTRQLQSHFTQELQHHE